MTDILLLCAPSDEIQSDRRSGENLGILYLEASLKRSGYSCFILDGLNYNLSFEVMSEAMLLNMPSLFTGFSVFMNNIKNTVKMVRLFREKGYKGHITLGGMWPSFKYREILSQIKEVDTICVGEGEEFVTELADCLCEGKNFTHIGGLATREKTGTVIFNRKSLKDNIDDLPVPDRRGYYFDIIKDRDEISILFSRGCHGGCSFCNISSYIKLCGGSAWRHRDVKKVIDEIEHIIKTTGIKYFRFVDDNFLGPSMVEREKCFDLAEEIIKRKFNMEFIITSRVEGITYEVFEKMKEAGLVQVNLGVESWVDSQLRRYNKKVTVTDNLEAVKILEELHIPYYCFIIPFDPYVTGEEVKENLYMIGKTGLEHTIHTHFTNKMAINQYQPLFEKCIKDNLIKNFNEKDISCGELEYVQFHRDVQPLIKAGHMVDELYYKCLNKLIEVKKGKSLCSPQWFRVQKEIIKALKEKLYHYFVEYVNKIGNDGSECIHSKMDGACENIFSFCDNITQNDLEELKEYIIDIDGIKISTRPEGFNAFVSKIMSFSSDKIITEKE